MIRRLSITLSLTFAGSLYAQHSTAMEGGNVLVIVADDLGKEVLSIYDTPAKQRAKTPNINRLAQQGVVFDNVWGSPLSAPVRAAMLTGRYCHHTGVLSLGTDLPTSEQTLFEALPDSYSSAVIGKWHLCQEFDFAADYGLDHFAGIAKEGGVRNYSRWLFTVDGESSISTEYATTQITNSAKEWIGKQTTPWVCWVAYNAPHTPLHLPPSNMHSQKRLSGDAQDIAKNPIPYYLAMVESLDYDIGRLLKSVDDQTTIIFIGDNGTERSVLQSPYVPSHGKGSLYESGVAIPMIIRTGDNVRQGQRSATMVSAVDIFPTVMEFAGEKMPQYGDGYSFASGESPRQYNFSEILNRRLGYMNAVSDGRYKLITCKRGTEEFYDTAEDLLETKNLLLGKLSLGESTALKALRAELARMNIPIESIPDTTPTTSRTPSSPNRAQTRGNSSYNSRYIGNQRGGVTR